MSAARLPCYVRRLLGAVALPPDRRVWCNSSVAPAACHVIYIHPTTAVFDWLLCDDKMMRLP